MNILLLDQSGIPMPLNRLPLESFNPAQYHLTRRSAYCSMSRVLLRVEPGPHPALMDTFEFFNWLETAFISDLEDFGRGEMPMGVDRVVRF
jgi:hypothetical protein